MIRIVWDKELSPVWLTKFVVVLTGIFVLVLCSLTAVHSGWEDRTEVGIEKTVYDTIQFVRNDYWLDQADRDSVQVIFREEHYTRYEEYSSTSITDQSPHFDSVFYDTIRYYRRR